MPWLHGVLTSSHSLHRQAHESVYPHYSVHDSRERQAGAARTGFQVLPGRGDVPRCQSQRVDIVSHLHAWQVNALHSTAAAGVLLPRPLTWLVTKPSSVYVVGHSQLIHTHLQQA